MTDRRRPSIYFHLWIGSIILAGLISFNKQAVLTVGLILTVLLIVGAVRGNPSSIQAKRRR